MNSLLHGCLSPRQSSPRQDSIEFLGHLVKGRMNNLDILHHSFSDNSAFQWKQLLSALIRTLFNSWKSASTKGLEVGFGDDNGKN